MNAQPRHSSKYINQNWRIKVSGFTGKEKLHTLIGVSRLVSILGADITDTLIEKATERGIDKITFRFRRGLKVTLYGK
jgi:hypothetical protein